MFASITATFTSRQPPIAIRCRFGSQKTLLSHFPFTD
jgi:hypothetical protein